MITRQDEDTRRMTARWRRPNNGLQRRRVDASRLIKLSILLLLAAALPASGFAQRSKRGTRRPAGKTAQAQAPDANPPAGRGI